jgi:hypothetical protein
MCLISESGALGDAQLAEYSKCLYHVKELLNTVYDHLCTVISAEPLLIYVKGIKAACAYSAAYMCLEHSVIGRYSVAFDVIACIYITPLCTVSPLNIL